jgi:hypothetical protein
MPIWLRRFNIKKILEFRKAEKDMYEKQQQNKPKGPSKPGLR